MSGRLTCRLVSAGPPPPPPHTSSRYGLMIQHAIDPSPYASASSSGAPLAGPSSRNLAHTPSSSALSVLSPGPSGQLVPSSPASLLSSPSTSSRAIMAYGQVRKEEGTRGLLSTCAAVFYACRPAATRLCLPAIKYESCSAPGGRQAGTWHMTLSAVTTCRTPMCASTPLPWPRPAVVAARRCPATGWQSSLSSQVGPLAGQGGHCIGTTGDDSCEVTQAHQVQPSSCTTVCVLTTTPSKDGPLVVAMLCASCRGVAVGFKPCGDSSRAGGAPGAVDSDLSSEGLENHHMVGP